jgi:hypothetical protein
MAVIVNWVECYSAFVTLNDYGHGLTGKVYAHRPVRSSRSRNLTNEQVQRTQCQF